MPARANPAKPGPSVKIEVDEDLNPAQPGPPGGKQIQTRPNPAQGIVDPKPEQTRPGQAHANVSYMNPSTPRRTGLKTITFLITWWSYVRPYA